MRAVAVLLAVEGVPIRARCLCAVIGIPGEVVAAHHLFGWKGAGLDARRVVLGVVRHVATPAEHRVVVVNAGVDDADAHPLAGGGELAAVPDIGRPNEWHTGGRKRPELRHRLDIRHAVEPAEALHLAERQSHLERVGQAAEPRLDRPADLAKPDHESVLLHDDFGDTNAGGLGDFARVQALCAEAHGNVRRRFAGKLSINQARLRRPLSAQRPA